jgi:hypothetical protein
MGMHIRKGGKFMKLKKKSGLMGAVIALSAASLVSVGFASWVISQGDEVVATGTIAVDNVVQNNYSFSDWTNGTLSNKAFTLADSQRIVYGADEFDTSVGTNYAWLSNSGSLKDTEVSSDENLEASFTFKVKANETYVGTDATEASASLALNDGYGYSVSVSAIAPSKTWDTTAGTNDKQLLGALQQPTLAYSGGVFTCTINFSWGSYFTVGSKIVNPMTYFNSKNPAEVSGIETEAYNVLNAIDTYLTGMTYSITLSISK